MSLVNPDLRVPVKVDPIRIALLREESDSELRKIGREIIKSWEGSQRVPDALASDDPVLNSDGEAKPLSKPVLVTQKRPGGQIVTGVRFQVIHYPGTVDARSFVEIALWTPGDGRGVSMIGSLGERALIDLVEASRRALSLLRSSGDPFP